MKKSLLALLFLSLHAGSFGQDLSGFPEYLQDKQVIEKIMTAEDDSLLLLDFLENLNKYAGEDGIYYHDGNIIHSFDSSLKMITVYGGYPRVTYVSTSVSFVFGEDKLLIPAFAGEVYHITRAVDQSYHLHIYNKNASTNIIACYRLEVQHGTSSYQTLKIHPDSAGIWDDWQRDMSLPIPVIKDINFDGYDDLEIMTQEAASGNKLYEVFLYHPSDSSFRHSKKLAGTSFKADGILLDPSKRVAFYLSKNGGELFHLRKVYFDIEGEIAFEKLYKNDFQQTGEQRRMLCLYYEKKVGDRIIAQESECRMITDEDIFDSFLKWARVGTQ